MNIGTGSIIILNGHTYIDQDQNGEKAGQPRLNGLRYDAVRNNPINRPVYISSKSEDAELTTLDRQSIISQARTLQRNFTLAGFVVRKHLQAIAYYRFSAKTPNREFNRRLESLMARWQQRQNCDATGVHCFDDLINLIEYHRAIDGDVGILATRDNKFQIIESDRIRNGYGAEFTDEWVHGVRIGLLGQPLAYSVCRRTRWGGFEPEKFVSAKHLKMIGYYSRRDQVRGVSLLAPALKPFASLYESLDAAQAKIKLEQLIGLKTIMDDSEPLGTFGRTQESTDERQADIDAQTDFLDGQLIRLRLRPGEDAAFLDGNTPSTNFQSWCELVLRIIFSSFDIPYSFFDGSKTNYYGSEGEFEQYTDGVERKQAATIAILNELTFDNLLVNWLITGELELPPGYTLENIRADCGWSGAGLPSWRMFRRVKEMLTAIQAGFISPYYAVGEYGHDIERNLEDLASLKRLADAQGITLPFMADVKTNIGL